VPLAILGVSPFVFVTCLTFNTLYQFWIHTRAIGKLGLVERVMNTPSHHRIHHAIDPEYIDKNYAGVFITWDKLFGTFVEEGVEPNYGTVKPLASMNSFWANFEGFARLWQMSRATESWKDKLLVWVMPPEWQPEDLGGIVTVPHVDRDARVKYDVMKNRALFRYIGVQFVGAAGLVFGVLWYASELGVLDKAALVSVTFLTLATWGALLERRAWAMPTESARLVLLGLALAWVFRASDLVLYVAAGWACFAAASAYGLVASVREDRARRDDAAARAQADDRDGTLEPAG
jgi:hypothetical protein